MRLITRLDFDGVACGALLREAGIVDEIFFIHPRELHDNTMAIDSNDVIANLPYVEGCGLWFDHHTSETERTTKSRWPGASYSAPSCARVIFDYYGGAETFPFAMQSGLIEAVDKCDSGMLCKEEIRTPEGWVLLSFVLDPRTGLYQSSDYRIPPLELACRLIEDCREKYVDEILSHPDVAERVECYFRQERRYEKMLEHAARVVGNVLILNLLEKEQISAGNRFKEYVMFTEQNVSIRVMWGLNKKNVVLACGKSIINRSCSVDIGNLMSCRGGGGHRDVGTCQVEVEQWELVLEELVRVLLDKD